MDWLVITDVDGVPFQGLGVSRQHPEMGPMVWQNRLRDHNAVTCTIGCHPGVSKHTPPPSHLDSQGRF